MSMPDRAQQTVEINAAPAAVYDLVSDMTRMGEWSPECVSCEWLDAPGEVGSRFKGRNKRGVIRWTTTARVLAADRPNRFEFATLNGDKISTKWAYTFEGEDRTQLTESFEAVSTPRFIAFFERILMPKRQQQLEEGIAKTLQAIKAAAEAAPAA